MGQINKVKKSSSFPFTANQNLKSLIGLQILTNHKDKKLFDEKD